MQFDVPSAATIKMVLIASTHLIVLLCVNIINRLPANAIETVSTAMQAHNIDSVAVPIPKKSH